MNYFLDTKNFLSAKVKRYIGSSAVDSLRNLEKYLKAKTFSSNKEYSAVVKEITSFIKDIRVSSSVKYPFYEKEIVGILKESPLTEKIEWGGVTLKKVDVEKDYIKKLLVIGKNGVLGFEIHRLKHERLKILEGVCLVWYSNHNASDWEKGKVAVKIAIPGDRFEFLPNDEHGIITITKCVIEETSTNHLDDLVCIFFYRVIS